MKTKTKGYTQSKVTKRYIVYFFHKKRHYTCGSVRTEDHAKKIAKVIKRLYQSLEDPTPEQCVTLRLTVKSFLKQKGW